MLHSVGTSSVSTLRLCLSHVPLVNAVCGCNWELWTTLALPCPHSRFSSPDAVCVPLQGGVRLPEGGTKGSMTPVITYYFPPLRRLLQSVCPSKVVFVLKEGERWITDGGKDFSADLRPALSQGI